MGVRGPRDHAEHNCGDRAGGPKSDRVSNGDDPGADAHGHHQSSGTHFDRGRYKYAIYGHGYERFHATGGGELELNLHRREWNESAQTWRASPVHDHASHGADAARYMCLGAREEQPKPIERPVREPWEYAQPGEMNIEWMRL